MTMLSQPNITPVADGIYMLDEDYIYTWAVNTGKRRIIVPKGFEYDGASVPRLFWSITGITPDGLHRAAALVHDWIYVHDGKLPSGSYQAQPHKAKSWKDVPTIWTRKQADKLFGAMMREAGIARWKRHLMYRAVRLFGWTYWND